MSTNTPLNNLPEATEPRQSAPTAAPGSTSHTVPSAMRDDDGFGFEKDRLRQQLAKCRAQALAQHLQAARHLRELRQELFPGEWSRLFADGSLPIKHLRTAQLWVRVAGNTTVMSPSNHNRLPAVLSSLSALARVKPEVLQAALDAGRITPDSTAREVKAFVREACGLPSVKTKVPPIPMLL